MANAAGLSDYGITNFGLRKGRDEDDRGSKLRLMPTAKEEMERMKAIERAKMTPENWFEIYFHWLDDKKKGKVWISHIHRI